jgi:hypothetical protein
MKKTITLLALALLTTTFTFAQTVIWQNSSTPTGSNQYGVNNLDKMGQQFIVASPNTSIQEITLYLAKNDVVETNYIVSIYNDNGYQIGTKIADIATGSNSTLSYSMTTVTINSTNCLNNLLPITLNAGSRYWVVLTTSNSEYILWCYDSSNASINGTGASTQNYGFSTYSPTQPFFMKITAGAPVVTALDKTTSDEVSVEAVAKTISINSVFENYTVELTNAAGAKVLTQQITQSGNTSIAADVAQGLYFVKVSVAGRCFIKKVFLQ